MEKLSITTYEVMNNLSIKLVEMPKLNKSQKCTYCGKGNSWYETWPSALVLSKYFAKEFPRERLDGCRALVIGSGVGLEGLALAKLGANVTFLDHIPEALNLVSYNCLLNGIVSFQKICCCWKDLQSVHNIGKYDLVIGSDVLYYFFYYLYLDEWFWIQSLLKSTLKTNGIAIFSDPIRFDETDFFRLISNSGFKVKLVDQIREYKDHRISIHCIEHL